jgi:hypothetical protein
MDILSRSISDLARDINGALVRLGKTNMRREFNIELWSCNRDRALELIKAYHNRLLRLAQTTGVDDAEDNLFAPLHS